MGRADLPRRPAIADDQVSADAAVVVEAGPRAAVVAEPGAVVEAGAGAAAGAVEGAAKK
jgi:hypothetical protein